MTAVPTTIWSARRWMQNTPCTSASNPPANMPMRTPMTQEPVRSAPQAPKNAPINIIPSSPMFTTPLRSENMPPIAAKTSTVVNHKAPDRRVDQRTASSRCWALAWVAAAPAAIPIRPLATAPQPIRPSPRVTAPTPRSAPIAPTIIGTKAVRTASGGRAIQNAMMPSAIPTIPTVAHEANRRGARSASVATLTLLPPSCREPVASCARSRWTGPAAPHRRRARRGPGSSP